MKKISVYVKSGPQAATAYYRFIQFFDKIDCQFKYRKQLTDKQYARFMPLSEQGIIIKAIFYIMIVGKFFCYLFFNFFKHVFSHSTHWTNPCIWKIFKFCSFNFFIIYMSTNCTSKFHIFFTPFTLRVVY